ncbi:hypothetical protein ACFL2Q_19270, partial [Thermodesulfobacteriota bacterium]
IYAFDAARLIVEGVVKALNESPALREQLSKGTDPSILRNNIRLYLESLSDERNAVDGLSGPLYFAENSHNMSRPILFSWIQGDGFVPAYIQLKAKAEYGKPGGCSDPLLATAVRGEDIVCLNRTQIVFCGIDVSRVNNVSLSGQDFDAEFFVWLRWEEPKAGSDGESRRLNPIDIGKALNDKAFRDGIMQFWDGIYGIEDKTDVIVHSVPENSGVKTIVFKVKSTFKNSYDLKMYPFDTPRLKILMSLADSSFNDVLLVVDTKNISGALVKDVYPAEYIALKPPVHDSGITSRGSSLGNPGANTFSDPIESKFSTYRVELDFRRKLFPYALKMFIPIFILNVVSLLSFFAPKDEFSVRMSMALTALLSTLVLHLSLASNLPNVGYASLADSFFVVSYVLMGVAIVALLLLQWLSEHSELRFKVLNHTVAIGLFVFAYSAFWFLTKEPMKEKWFEDLGYYHAKAGIVVLFIVPLAGSLALLWLAKGHLETLLERDSHWFGRKRKNHVE